MSSKRQAVCVATVNPFDHKQQYVNEADKRQLRSKVSLVQPITEVSGFPKAIWQRSQLILSRTSVEASFSSDFNALDILNCERHLSASSKAESKLATSSFTEFAIFRIFPQELNV